MSTESNVTAPGTITQDSLQGGALAAGVQRSLPPGLVLGALGVLGFSFSLPATRLAVADLDPWLVAFGRAVVAGLLSVAVLALTRAPRPTPAQWRSLGLVALGVVVGFPLFTSLALQSVPASHVAVVFGAPSFHARSASQPARPSASEKPQCVGESSSTIAIVR